MILRLTMLAGVFPLLLAAQVPDTIGRLDEQQASTAFLKGPNGTLYPVEMTDEMEEDTLTFESVARRGSLEACVTANFTGIVRRKAKTSSLPGRPKSFDTLDDLLATLPPDSAMQHHNPPIDNSAFSERVEEERHSVLVKKAWLLAVFREEDNDFHLIIGNRERPDEATALMNVEVSGLPDKATTSRSIYKTLLDARTEFIKIFGDTQCRRTFRFKDKGVPVEIKGSLFFDIHHVSTGTGSGNLHPASVWEIHPVTGIVWLTE